MSQRGEDPHSPQFEKASAVAKLAAARKRKRETTGKKCEARRSHAEARPEVVDLARRLRRRKPKGGQLRLRAISAELATAGDVNERGPAVRSEVGACNAGEIDWREQSRACSMIPC